MNTQELTRLVQNQELHTINTTLGPVATFFWITYANYAIDGNSVTQAVERTLKLIQSYLGPDAIQSFNRSLGQVKAA